VERAKEFIIFYKRADPARILFERRNLYDLTCEARTFDEVICFEVLEHLLRDRDMAREFFRILRPGGVLHLRCPNRLHPRHQADVLDTKESGGHVRTLLERICFQIECVVGIGTPAVYGAGRSLRAIRNEFGDWAALPLLPTALSSVGLATFNPRIPFSLYAEAIKPGGVL
jgi:SAM-dependent methyltransferase